VLGYAADILKARRELWPPALLLTLIAGAPGALVATLLAPAATTLLLTADPVVALHVLPEPWRTGDPLAWGATVLGLLAVGLLWVRLYLLLLWISDVRKSGGLAAAWRATRPGWRRGLALYAEAQAAVLLVFALFLVPVFTFASSDVALLAAFGATFVAFVLRAAIRVALTMALRGVALDGCRHVDAWKEARAVLRERRRDAVAAWVTLAAAGVAVWIGGRLITPVLQDTALRYGHASPSTFLREATQLLYAAPLEAFLLVLSTGVWTALYLGGDQLRERKAEPGIDRATRRALAALVVLVVAANGVPTLIERSEDQRLVAERRRIQAREIRPADARRAVAASKQPVPAYEVDASLADGRLAWETTVTWRNEGDETVDTLGLNVYPNAFTRAVEDIPLASDVLQSPLGHRDARPGTLEVDRITVEGEAVDGFALDDTALTIPLPRPLRPGDTTTVAIRLCARLPRFPERFGTWRDISLLGNWIPVMAIREGGAWRFDEYGTIGDPFVSRVAHYRVRLTLPHDQEPVGTGVLIEVEPRASETTWTFEAAAARDAAFAVSPYWRGRESEIDGLRVRAWYPADRPHEGEQAFAAAVSSARDYVRRFGSLPADELDVVLTNGILGGMEYPGVVFVAEPQEALEGFPILPELLSHAGLADASRRYIVGHEVAHQWWYASTGSDQVREPWLDEALAEFSTRTWLESEEGGDRTWVLTNLSLPRNPAPGVVTRSTHAFRDNTSYFREIYLGGSEVLMEMREAVGRRSVDQILFTWHQRTRGGLASVADFAATVRDVGGADAAAVLDRYR
jgi:hypothetical protein